MVAIDLDLTEPLVKAPVPQTLRDRHPGDFELAHAEVTVEVLDEN